jgi:16S rRNA (guanine966-N2)-methyltransferase
MLAPRIEDARFLDLYAGTGANGIEALSRGAKLALFIDHSSDGIELIQQNLLKTRLNTKGKVKKARLPQSLQTIGIKTRFDIIFADPPYDTTDLMPLLDEIHQAGVLDPEGVFIVEHDRKVPAPEMAGPLRLARTKTYGTTQMSWYVLTD